MAHAQSTQSPIEHALEEWDNDALAFYPYEADTSSDGYEGSNLYLLLEALYEEFEGFEDDLDKIEEAMHIVTAQGLSLDFHGAIVRLPRRHGEPDAKYRKRLITKLRAGITGTTIDETIQFAAFLMDTDPTNIEISYNWDTYQNTAIIDVSEAVLNNAMLTEGEIAARLKEVAPAGGDIIIEVGGSFILRGAGTTSDPAKGLTGDNTSEGGTLAGALSANTEEDNDYGSTWGQDWGS